MTVSLGEPPEHITAMIESPTMPERLALSLEAEGASETTCKRYARALHNALTKSPGFGPVGIYEGHAPKRVALAQSLAKAGHPKSASLVWSKDEAIEVLHREWEILTARELASMLGYKPQKGGE